MMVNDGEYHKIHFYNKKVFPVQKYSQENVPREYVLELLSIIIIFILLILSALVSAAEASIIAVNKIRIAHLAKSGNKRAKISLEYKKTLKISLQVFYSLETC